MLNKIKNNTLIKKTIFVFCMLCLLAVNSFAQAKNIPFNPTGSKILLYSEPNFKGKQLVIDGVGEYDFAAVRITWNNNISSAQIPKGYTITFYDERHKEGAELPTAAVIDSKTNKGLSIVNFKKVTCSYQSPKQSDADFGKKMTVNFDNITSFMEVEKL